jgi:putative addiction module component (TIGR02574 family)
MMKPDAILGRGVKITRGSWLGHDGATDAILTWSRSMAKPVPLPPPGFDDLSVDEKIDYLQSLWNRIAATPETIPVPDWHREIIDERLKDLEANPEAGDSWETVQDRLRKKLDDRH